MTNKNLVFRTSKTLPKVPVHRPMDVPNATSITSGRHTAGRFTLGGTIEPPPVQPNHVLKRNILAFLFLGGLSAITCNLTDTWHSFSVDFRGLQLLRRDDFSDVKIPAADEAVSQKAIS